MVHILGVKQGNVIVPYQSVTKRTKQVDNTVLALSSSTGSGFSVSSASAVAYADSTGKWRLAFNYLCSWSGGATTAQINTTGVSFATYEAISACDVSAATTVTYIARTLSATSTLNIIQSASSTTMALSGDVSLASKPTWADANMEGTIAADVYIPFGTTGMPGEYALTGTTQRSGTGGYTYSARSSTHVPSTGLTSVISLTLNTGSYLISGIVSEYQSASASLGAQLYVGGVAVTSLFYSPMTTGSRGLISMVVPVTITTNGTVVAIYAQISSGTGVDSFHEMWAVRLAP